MLRYLGISIDYIVVMILHKGQGSLHEVVSYVLEQWLVFEATAGHGFMITFQSNQDI